MLAKALAEVVQLDACVLDLRARELNGWHFVKDDGIQNGGLLSERLA